MSGRALIIDCDDARAVGRPLRAWFFGITRDARRIAGGIVVTLTGWQLLQASEEPDGRKQAQAADAGNCDDIVLFPLTIPIATGPGAISVAITLGSEHPHYSERLVACFLGLSAATVALAVVIWITRRSADRISRLMGPTGSRTVTRLSAFLLLCIGVQIVTTGAAGGSNAATDDTTLAAARDRAEKSMAFAKSITVARIEGTEDQDISWTAGGAQRTMNGRAYLLHFCLPNLCFHTTTAYTILRHRGIGIGKRDFLGTF